MHEWALAEAIIQSLLNIANEKKARRVKEVGIKIGELQQIDIEAFTIALKELSKGTFLEGIEVKIKEERASFRCRVCGFEWKLEDIRNEIGDSEKEYIHFIPEVVHAFLKCPRCGSHDFEIKKGRGLWISYIKIER